jgi:hypothetical protein
LTKSRRVAQHASRHFPRRDRLGVRQALLSIRVVAAVHEQVQYLIVDGIESLPPTRRREATRHDLEYSVAGMNLRPVVQSLVLATLRLTCDLHAQRWLSDTKSLASTGEVPFLGHRNEIARVSKFYGTPPGIHQKLSKSLPWMYWTLALIARYLLSAAFNNRKTTWQRLP